MANVSEDSLKSGGFSPNLYVKNILLEKGSSIDLRGAPANSGEQFVILDIFLLRRWNYKVFFCISEQQCR